MFFVRIFFLNSSNSKRINTSDKESDIEQPLLVFGKIILNYINKFKNSILMDSVLLKSYSMKKNRISKRIIPNT